jgi:hypothetical protein
MKRWDHLEDLGIDVKVQVQVQVKLSPHHEDILGVEV